MIFIKEILLLALKSHTRLSAQWKKITIRKHVVKWSFQECTFTQQKQNYRFNKRKTSKFYKASETKRLRSVKTRQEFEILTPSNCKKWHLLRSCLSEKAHCSVFFLRKIVFVPGSPRRAFRKIISNPLLLPSYAFKLQTRTDPLLGSELVELRKKCQKGDKGLQALLSFVTHDQRPTSVFLIYLHLKIRMFIADLKSTIYHWKRLRWDGKEHNALLIFLYNHSQWLRMTRAKSLHDMSWKLRLIRCPGIS